MIKQSLNGAWQFRQAGAQEWLLEDYWSRRDPTPDTAENESFDALFLGFYDWGAWWQGEIAGEYFLANSNSISHQLRLHLSPAEPLSCGLIGYVFRLPEPGALVRGVTAKEIAVEVDIYADWSINDNFVVSVIGAYADPQEAIEQAFGRTSSFTYGMLYLAYSL